MVVPAEPKSTSQLVTELYDRRVTAGLCKYDARDRGKPPHPAPTRNKRRKDGRFTMCEGCYAMVLASKRRRPDE